MFLNREKGRGCFIYKWNMPGYSYKCYICLRTIKKESIMTLDEFTRMYSGRPYEYIKTKLFRGMRKWEEFGLYDKLEEYFKWQDGHEEKGKELFSKYQLRYMKDRREFMASFFFEKFCGWKWGGAGMYLVNKTLVEGSYFDDDGPHLIDLYVPVAVMEVFIDGERVEFSAYGGYEFDDRDGHYDYPDAVPDVTLCCVRRPGRTFTPVMTEFCVGGDRHSFGDGRIIPWDMLEDNTWYYLSGNMEMDYDIECMEDERLDSYEGQLEQMRIDKYERERCRDDWDNEIETLDALGYDTDRYLEDRDWWMY